MDKPHVLQILNPSDYPRAGHVTIPWADIQKVTGIPPERLLVRQGDREVPAQVDEILPGDPSLTILSFSLAEPVGPGVDDYSKSTGKVTLVSGDRLPHAGGPRVELEPAGSQPQGFRLANDILEVWFNLTPYLREEASDLGVYAGSATTVLLRGREVLDAWPNWGGHDLEKRCMQLDRIRLSQPAWSPSEEQEVSFFDRPHRVVAITEGPLRASVTVASEPFEYTYVLPGSSEERSVTCSLFRIISMYAGVDSVLDEFFIRGSDGGKPLDLWFTPRYFNYWNVGDFRISQFPSVPDWFAVTSEGEPFHSYGFATDIHARQVSNPHPEFPDWDKADNSFSWMLYRCGRARCLHRFSLLEAGFSPILEEWRLSDFSLPRREAMRRESESRAGRAWYEVIYKPLSARL